MSDSSVQNAGAEPSADKDLSRKQPKRPGRPPAPQESMIDRIRQLYGAQSRVMLHESPEESGPILSAGPQNEAPSDDSHYQILGLIAKGGVGVVYKARDKNLGREVALKVLRSDRTQVAQVAERLVEEAQVGGQLQHPGIVPVYALGMQKDGRPHFAMKLIKGVTLASLLQERAKPQDDQPRLIAIFEQVCQTMAYCHDHGVIHRDLKPSNIMVGAFGETLIVDWGFGKVISRDSRGKTREVAAEPLHMSIVATLRSGVEGSQSIAGSIMGTPAYMPPEQALGQIDALDERADVFALGALLCEILTGEPPYVGDLSDILIMAAQGKVESAYARLDACGAGQELIDLAKKCLSSLIAERPRNAGVLAARVHDHFAGVEERARLAKVQSAQAAAQEQEEKARLAAKKLDAEKERARAAEERIKAERAKAAAEEHRRAVLWERQRRRRTLLLAAAVLLLLLGGGGSYLVVTGGKRDREEKREAEIAARLGEATDLAGAQRWSEAAAAAEGALPLLGPDGGERRDRVRRLLESWKSRQAELDAAAAQQERDLKVRERLRDLRAAAMGSLEPVAIDAGYAAAFRDYGADVEAGGAGEAGKVLSQSSLRVELAAALDEWANLRRGAEPLRGKDWRVLLTLANQVDSDPRRMRLREERANERMINLVQMASLGDVDSLPLPTVVHLANALLSFGDAPGAVRLLRRARELHPDDIYVHLGLSAALVKLNPPRYGEAARHSRAALALQPGSQGLRRAVALALGNSGDWPAAAAALEAIARGQPEDHWTHEHLADALNHVGDLEGAVAAAQRAVALDPRCAEARRILLDALGARADVAAYLAQCEAATQEFPGEPRLHAHLARAKWRSGDAPGALAAAEEAAKAEPSEPYVCETLAELQLAFGRPAQAVTTMQAAVDAHPGDLVAERGLALATTETAQIVDAEPEFIRRVRFNPADIGAHWGLAGAYRVRGDLQREMQHRRLVAQLSPYDAEAHRALADFLQSRPFRYEEAISAYRRAIELRPETARYHAGLALALARRGDREGARAACLRAQQLDPRDATVQSDCALVLFLSGSAAEAKAAAARAVAAAPEVHGVLQVLGACQSEIGDLDGALETLERAVKLGPECPPARLLLGRARRARGDVEGAAADFQKVVELRPTDYEARVALGGILEVQGEDAAALEAYLSVLNDAPRFTAGYVAAARLYCRAARTALRNKEEALRLAQRGLDLDPNSAPAWGAMALARYRNGDAAGALAACAKALDGAGTLDPEMTADTLLVRAMAEHETQRTSEARASYRKGMQMMKEAGAPPLLERLGAEATALLGEEAK